MFERIMKTELRPSVWYFDNDEDLPNQGKYAFKINKMDTNDINISRPYSNNYYIECMKCLKENDFLNICDINCIFDERCKKMEILNIRELLIKYGYNKSSFVIRKKKLIYLMYI
ncbi:hypothetical protein JTS93_12320 [Clostridium botulinum]|nr:hypothetical protein [Clostridium botulinum]